MIYSLSEGLGSLKRNWKELVSASRIEEVCRESGVKWRERVLTPVQTIHLMLLQVLHGNTAISHLRFFTQRNFTPSAFCQARKRVPLEVFERLLNQTSRVETPCGTLWHGRPVYHVDGSTFSMPDSPELREHFGYPFGQQKGCGFPVAHFVALVHAGSGMIKRVLSGALFTHDLSSFIALHPALSERDVVVGDRIFGSYAHLALLIERGVDAVFRMTGTRIVKFSGAKSGPTSTRERRLGVRDQIVRWSKPKRPPLWMSEAQFTSVPQELRLRELAYRVDKRGFRTREVILVTTLLNSEDFTVNELAELYKRRWDIETCFSNLKTTMEMDVLHCQSISGVLKEFTCFCIVYNLVRAVMLQAAQKRGVAPARISFIDALRWLLAAATRKLFYLPRIVPARPWRFEPRAIKRRPKQYDRLNKPRADYALP